MTYGHRTGYTGNPVADRVVPLPEDLDPLLGIYVAHMGPICANGLLHAAADLCGPDVRSLGDGVRGREGQPGCGSARSSTTTPWRYGAPRSAGCCGAWRTPGTGSGSPPRRSTFCARMAPRSEST